MIHEADQITSASPRRRKAIGRGDGAEAATAVLAVIDSAGHGIEYSPASRRPPRATPVRTPTR